MVVTVPLAKLQATTQVLNRTEMVPRGPSFEIGSAHAQNAPANRKIRPPHPRSRLHSAPSRELAL